MSLTMTSPPASISVRGGRVLGPGGFAEADLAIAEGRVARTAMPAGRTLDATGLLVLPGIVDIHGDAFERQMMPRPGVGIEPAVALLDTDRQLAANGITTAFHAVTWSWEPGLRGAGTVRPLLAAIEAARPSLAIDTRVHLRHETYNLEAEAEIVAWLERGRIACLAFNDHMADTLSARERPDKLRAMLDRTGMGEGEFLALAGRVAARAPDVAASVARLAAAGRRAGIPMLSHDDASPGDRARYRAMGCRVAEFPLDQATAGAAAREGDPIVFGAPNVLRGGSHKGNPDAAGMASRGLCSALASDYFYPALLQAPFRLAATGRLNLADAWALVSSGPADAVALGDRGNLVDGSRADVILVAEAPVPRVVATMVAGRIVLLTETERLA